MSSLAIRLAQSLFKCKDTDTSSNILSEHLYYIPFKVIDNYFEWDYFDLVDYIFTPTSSITKSRPFNSETEQGASLHAAWSLGGFKSSGYKKDPVRLAIGPFLTQDPRTNRTERLFTKFRKKYLGGKRPYYLTGAEVPCFFEAIAATKVSYYYC